MKPYYIIQTMYEDDDRWLFMDEVEICSETSYSDAIALLNSYKLAYPQAQYRIVYRFV